MKVIENNNMVCFDCDDTLVMWYDAIPDEELANVLIFRRPDNGLKEALLPHKVHIAMLKLFKSRGYHVTVWSAGGYEWAAEVVKVLELEQYVDTVMTKPKWVVDDLPSAEWLKRIYRKVDDDMDMAEYLKDGEVTCG